jgi:hypothetical protein
MTRDSLIAAIQSGLVPKWAFFWGHTPAKDGSVTKSCFSQWWDGHPFEIKSIRYATAEHFMMAEKATPTARLWGGIVALFVGREGNPRPWLQSREILNLQPSKS